MQDACAAAGAPLTVHPLPLESLFGLGAAPPDSPGFYQDGSRAAEDRIVDEVAAALPPGTRLAVFDSVTSNTALVLPIKCVGHGQLFRYTFFFTICIYVPYFLCMYQNSLSACVINSSSVSTNLSTLQQYLEIFL